MNEVKSDEFRVEQAADVVWAKLSDLSVAHLYVPGLTGTKVTTENAQGVGASRQVFSKRPPMDETVIEWKEGAGMLLRLHHGEKDNWGPFKQVFYRYGMRADGDGTILQNSMSFELKGGKLGQVLGGGLISKAFHKTLNDVTLAQKLYYETGEQVTPDNLKAAKSS
ncbi:MAG: SRPBCC family protein [Pseudomonadota bacterium]